MSAKQMKGKVISTKMDKTITVEVSHFLEHPRYGKRVRKSKKFLAHCENDVAEGDTVVIEETRPISKRKRWKVIKHLPKEE